MNLEILFDHCMMFTFFCNCMQEISHEIHIVHKHLIEIASKCIFYESESLYEDCDELK
jgi:hypothetical protein